MVKRRILITVLLVLGMVLPAAAHEVGWILMLPPLRPTRHRMLFDTGAPLSKWEVRESFDTAKECEAFRERLRIRYDEEEQKFIAKGGDPYIYYSTRFLYGRCVPASEVYPQAKEK